MKILLLVFIVLFGCQERYHSQADLKDFDIERGRQLALLAGCQRCHGSDLSGGTASNISPSQSGTGNYSLREIVNLIRDPRNESHKGYRWITDMDAFSMAGLIKALKPVDNGDVKEAKATSDYGLGFVPDIKSSNQIEYGKYLVKNIAACDACHRTEAGMFSNEVSFEEGEIEIDGEDYEVPALRGNEMTENDYQHLFLNGISKSKLEMPNCTADRIKASTVDIIAMSKYLSSLK